MRRLALLLVLVSALAVTAVSRGKDRPHPTGAVLRSGEALIFGPAGGPVAEGGTLGDWRVVFHGLGSVRSTGNTLALDPAEATRPNVTHGALAVSTTRVADTRVRARVRTDRALRRGSPANPWEVAWLLWRVRDHRHFYAVALKPNGWEISKGDPTGAGGQRFLASGSTPRFSRGHWHEVEVRHDDLGITVSANGRRLVEGLRDASGTPEHPSGAVGLYTEDAAVRFAGVTLARSRSSDATMRAAARPSP